MHSYNSADFVLIVPIKDNFGHKALPVVQLLYFIESKFFSEGMFSYRGYSLLQSEHPHFLHFPGQFFKIFLVKIEAF